MQEQFVTYEIAVKLAKLGFNEPCWFQFDEDGNLDWCYSEMKIETTEVTIRSSYLAPLWQQAIEFLSEQYNILIYIDFTPKESYFYRETKLGYSLYHIDSEAENENKINFYEAREQAILKALELCQNKKF